MVAVYRQDTFIQAQTPGSRDVLVFEKGARPGPTSGGIAHFGFRLVEAADIDGAARAVKAAGGRIVDRGSFAPDEPYISFKDPDGYLVEIWFERPTRVDPRV